MDLLAALEESVAKAKASRGETGGDGGHATVHEMPKPTKKTAAKEAARKRASWSLDAGARVLW
ncbi:MULTISPECIES: hypothetical protein [Streptomyces]|uniref:Uncharacterized protein n=1 Tax=Streptomyces venezuelae TaxID=54571 RepID=A0A5P2B582_STRVZ|nr:hypothetical protein [Streptomyces venezuelae]QES24321.1 hypothetical protein DEJ46_38945 [Streptomyces venezuelae]